MHEKNQEILCDDRELVRAEPGVVTIFIGAAPGVGKTYSMLETAKEKQTENKLVMIGWVDSHNRPEIQQIIEEIPSIEPIIVTYKGVNFQELDLDELIKKKPDIAIVDELAHSNAPHVRNKKRFQDIKELLLHGIDVYTTLNVYQIESLCDVISDITEMKIRETVPDSILEKAQIKVVDIDPETLIQRVHDGKVHQSDIPGEDFHHFFRPGNINALREIALRYAAKHVDKELSQYMTFHSIKGPWTTGEKVLVYLDTYNNSTHLLRIAKNLADSLQGELFVVFHQPPSYIVNDRVKTMVARANQVAEELGAEIITLSSNKLLESLIQTVKRNNITQLVIGKQKNPYRWLFFIREPLENRLLSILNNVRVHLIPIKNERKEKTAINIKFINSIQFVPLLFNILLVVLMTFFCRVFIDDLGLINVSTLFLIPILLSSLWGYQNSIIITLVSFLFYDFFFITPYNTFLIYDPRYLISLIISLSIAFLSGYVSILLQRKADLAEENHLQINSLFSLSKDISMDTNIDTISKKIIFEISEYTDMQTAILLPNKTGKLAIMHTSDDRLQQEIIKDDFLVSNWVFLNKQMAGNGTNTFGDSLVFYYPIISNQEIVGVLAMNTSWTLLKKETSLKRYLDASTHLTAIALHRYQLTEKANENKLMSESQKLQKALFDSISHDLNTPLTSIIGASSSLLDEGDLYSKADKEELLLSIQQDANDMNRLVRNLLDMAHLDNRIIQLHKEYADIVDIVDYCIRKMKHLSLRKVIRLIPSLPSILVDTALIEQVITNLLDNAIKYSPEGSQIVVRAYEEKNKLYFSIEDEGVGIDLAEQELVFSKFYRANHAKAKRGSGLGLTICKGIVEAHGGKIWVKKDYNKGTCIEFYIPYGGKLGE